MGLPTASVTFKPHESSERERAERGVLAIIVKDATSDFNFMTYARLTDVDSDDYTAANYKAISLAFLANPHKVIVVRIGTSGAISDATAILGNLNYDWVCAVDAGLQSGLVTYVKSVNTATRARAVKCVCTGGSAADDMHVINVANTTVSEKNVTGTTAMAAYLPRIAGIMAACPYSRSVTSWALDDLTDCAAVTSIDSSIDSGNLCLFKDDDTVRIARGVNTLQTLGTTYTEDMKKICVVEGMDRTKQEIVLLFKSVYQGRRKNSSDNQALMISDILGILADLTAEEVLDATSDATVEIDVAAMRNAWAAAGEDVTSLTDAQVKDKTVGSKVFLVARNMRFLDAMEDLTMEIQLG